MRLQVWNRDLVHTRAVCGVYSFSSQHQATSNAQHCDKVLMRAPRQSFLVWCLDGGAPDRLLHLAQCFCYVCDCPAKDCQEWGAGVALVSVPSHVEIMLRVLES